MPSIYVSTVIEAPAESVWQYLRDFNALPVWHPGIRDSEIENGEAADKIGCVRHFHLQNGDPLREQLLALSDIETFYTYSILESPMPLTDYVATLRVRPVTDGSLAFVEWSAEFNCAQADAEELVTTIGAGVFQGGFDAVKEHFSA